MKRSLLLLLACLSAALTSYAQFATTDSTAAPVLKPQAGQFATELNVNPFNGTLSLNNSINQIKFRYFASPTMAVRAGLNGSRVSESSKASSPYGSNPYRYEEEKSSTTVGVNIGFEKHLAGTRRLSPYFGADLILENKSSKHEITRGQEKETITGAWVTYTYIPGGPNYPSYTVTSHGERGYFRFGLNVVSGFDFYMARNFFFGYEVNFGFSNKNYQELEIDRTNSGGFPNDNRESKDSAFSFGPNLMNGVRVGYVF